MEFVYSNSVEEELPHTSRPLHNSLRGIFLRKDISCRFICSLSIYLRCPYCKRVVDNSLGFLQELAQMILAFGNRSLVVNSRTAKRVDSCDDLRVASGFCEIWTWLASRFALSGRMDSVRTTFLSMLMLCRYAPNIGGGSRGRNPVIPDPRALRR